jgi:hypothetical protein
MRRPSLLIIAAFFCLIFISCVEMPEKAGAGDGEIVAVSVSVDGQALTGVLSESGGDEVDYLFKMLSGDENIAEIKKGDTIEIDIQNKEVSSAVLYDYILNGDGSMRYNDDMTTKSSIVLSQGKYSLKLGKSLAEILGSADAKGESLLRGMRLNFEIGGISYDFAFLIKMKGD